MSDLEAKIRGLDLRAPGNTLDARVLAALRSEAATEDNVGVPLPEHTLHPHVSHQHQSTNPAKAGRRGIVITPNWLMSAACMMIGTIVGTFLPPVIPRASTHKAEVTTGTFSHADPQDSTSPMLTGNSPSESMDGQNTVGLKRQASSQIVESLWVSPTAAAVAWEQQTGKIFNVINHVNDRQFNMCRDCHRVGG